MGRCKAAKEFSNLKFLGFKILDIVSDGNCLFRSFADQLWADQERHLELRTNIVSYMRDYHDDFMVFISTNGGNRDLAPRSTRTKSKGLLNFEGASIGESVKAFEVHLQKMSKAHEWASEQEIFACAQLFNISIVVHQKDMAPRPYNEGQTKTIHIAYHGHRHYSSVRPIKHPDFAGVLSKDEENYGSSSRPTTTAPLPNPRNNILASPPAELSSGPKEDEYQSSKRIVADKPKRTCNFDKDNEDDGEELNLERWYIKPVKNKQKGGKHTNHKEATPLGKESRKIEIHSAQYENQSSKRFLIKASDKPRKTCNFDTDNEDDGEELNLERWYIKPVEAKQGEGRKHSNHAKKATPLGEESNAAPALTSTSTSRKHLLTPPLTPAKKRCKKRGINVFDSEGEEEDDWSTPWVPN
ncbi:hypothetical protein B7494_g5984 [Chlorociboria aeruginascens]|nr:hypothetical protein B7494_g5984 [Chlorociboria aeruginascens]